MSSLSSRRPRCVGATATYLNAGLWGSRFVGYCEVGTNGEIVWVKGYRVPLWMAWGRMASYLAFLPASFYAGLIFGETMVGRWGYPPYYYLASVLLTLVLVVLGLWGAGIWHETIGSYESVVWLAPKRRAVKQTQDRGVVRGHAVWTLLNTFVNANDRVQVEIPIGPGGKPRRLVLKTRDTGPSSLQSVLSGVYYGQGNQSVVQEADRARAGDPWGWSRN